MTTDEPSSAAPPSRGDGPRPRTRQRILDAPVTLGVIALCIGAFLVTLGTCTAGVDDPVAVLTGSWRSLERCEDTLAGLGALRLADLWIEGSWWRVVSAGLLHGSWIHLILNTWSLWVVGEWVESTWGHTRTAIVFALSSVAGCLASAAWVEASMVVGASAGIMGMAGALLVGRLLGRGVVRERLRPISATVLGGWLVVLVALGAFVPMIAQAGHLGGLVAGSLLGLAWSGQPAIITMAGRAGLTVVFIATLLGARQPEHREGYHEYLGYAYLERDQDRRAAVAFEQALEQRPDDPDLANGVAYGLAKAGIDLNKAERLVTRALGEQPDNPDYLDTLGWILCRQGEPELGMEALTRASELSGGLVAEIEQHIGECATAKTDG